MAIYIEGLEIPKEGESLYIKICPDGRVSCDLDLKCKRIATAYQVPEHGRLVDVGKLTVIAYTGTEGRPDTFDAGVEWLAEKIDALPTIIPKEEEA